MSLSLLKERRNSLLVQNRQHRLKLNTRLLRWITRDLLQDLLQIEAYDLSIMIVGDDKMTRLNEEHLRHRGTTDVITFDYNDPSDAGYISGDIFVCVDEAVRQARRFRTSWTSEIARYVVHGVLHLHGHDDTSPVKRRAMKREEDRLLRVLDQRFRTSKLGGHL